MKYNYVPNDSARANYRLVPTTRPHAALRRRGAELTDLDKVEGCSATRTRVMSLPA